jgi:flagellar hook-associated protein 3 FlgL
MIQNSDSVGQQFLANLQTLQQQMASTQAQVSSGYRVNQVSDDPGSVADILELESNLGSVNQVASNLSSVSGEVNTAEGALESATQLLEQATSLGAQGANSTNSASEQTGLSQQVEQILSQLVSISSTTFEGQYIFSGNQTSSPSYQLDPTSPTGVTQLITNPANRLIQDASGVTFAVSETAAEIFDSRDSTGQPDASNVFFAVKSLATALASNDQSAITTAMSSLQAASDYLAQQLQFYGGVQDQIANATSVAQKFQLQDQTTLGDVRNTDMASASVDLAREQTSYQAAIQAESTVPRTSLFNFLTSSGG